ncbi:unnamed protein product [Prunus armeniaca]|uniref:Uncharacterized protein n=1 Tax=Prunus armeniaca TaxID=36596 RepID=A0A6J5XDQ4_PRUAR|nr:unnamed protein product [Prunus armeniaca]
MVKTSSGRSLLVLWKFRPPDSLLRLPPSCRPWNKSLRLSPVVQGAGTVGAVR